MNKVLISFYQLSNLTLLTGCETKTCERCFISCEKSDGMKVDVEDDKIIFSSTISSIC